MTDDAPHYLGSIVLGSVPLPQRTFTDADLTEIYYKANPPTAGALPPIPTQRIFNAMRAMLEQ